MKENKKAGFSSYLAMPFMTIIGFAIASLVFIFILKDPSPVPVFIIFCVIQVICMILYAVLPGKGKTISRLVSMFLVGAFILLLAGMMGHNNFQLEGFYFYLLAGTMSGVVVHFMMGKIVGPIFFNRSWCSWGCWTAMFLDLLPFKRNTTWKEGLANLRYVHFFVSLLLVAIVYFGLKVVMLQTDPALIEKGMGTTTEMMWFLGGNAIYYIIGISMAFVMKDNRAFCKYICPLAVLFKTFNRAALVRIKGTVNKCDSCNTCTTNCPMSIDIPKYAKNGGRVKSSECIMCMKCIANCPEGILKTSVAIDFATKDHLK